MQNFLKLEPIDILTDLWEILSKIWITNIILITALRRKVFCKINRRPQVFLLQISRYCPIYLPKEAQSFVIWNQHTERKYGIASLCSRAQKRELSFYVFLSLIKFLIKTTSWWLHESYLKSLDKVHKVLKSVLQAPLRRLDSLECVVFPQCSCV